MRGCRPIEDHELPGIKKEFEGKQFSKRNKALFVLGCRTGFCISELLSLRVKDVYQQDKVVDRVWMARKNMKGKKNGRAVVIHQEAREAARDTADINFHYFEQGETEDLNAMVHGIKFSRRIMNDPLMKVFDVGDGTFGPRDVIKNHVYPRAKMTDKQLQDFVRNNSWGHHASCSHFREDSST